MTNEPINTPSLAGWAIAFGVGAVAFGVGLAVLGLGANGSVLVGAVLFLVVGVILGLPSGQPPVRPATVIAAAAAAPEAPVAAPVPPAPTPMPPPPVAVAPAPAPMPAPMPAPAPLADVAPTAPAAPAEKPPTLTEARGGRPDDLKQIKGVGPKMEAMLHRMGFFHFDQIADWKAAELAWVDDNLEGFKGRASRDEWVAQAKILAAGGSTEFSRRHEHD